MPLLVDLCEIDTMFENTASAREKEHVTIRDPNGIGYSSQCKEKEKIKAPLIRAVALPSL